MKRKIRPLAILEKKLSLLSISFCFSRADWTNHLHSRNKYCNVCLWNKRDLKKTVEKADCYQSLPGTFYKSVSHSPKRPTSQGKIDGSSLPPCKSLLQQKINRANCICLALNSVFTLNPNVFSPQTSGWNIGKDVDGKERFSVNLFEGDLAPQTLEDWLSLR